MRTLSSTLLAAQQSGSGIPYIKVEASNRSNGIVRLDWTRLYTGSEDDSPHALTLPGDGSIIRARITPPSDGSKLYRQRVANPGPGSDFSAWTYTGQYSCLAVGAASHGAEVSIFWINENREVCRTKSSDYGASWGSPETLDYTLTAQVGGITAAYKPDGDLAIFFADQNTLYIKKHVGGSWQEKTAWDKSTGNLSSVAAVYTGDWNLLVSGQDGAGNFKLWSLVYGDGADVAAGDWSPLKQIASAPADGSFTYSSAFLDKPDVYRCFYIESFAGTEAYQRPFWSHSANGGKFLDNLWREPAPFDASAIYGLAIAHYGDYCWLSAPFGIWRSSMAVTSLDLSADIIALKQELSPEQGRLTIELRNDDGRYASLPSPLEIGCQIDFSPGYVTSQGNEFSSGQSFILESYEYVSAGGKASLIIYADDGWGGISRWRARHQFRWNQYSEEANVRQVMEFLLARSGLRLETISQSSAFTGFYPDFAIHGNKDGDNIARSLLSFVPDVIFLEGDRAYVINPQSSASSVYSYGETHSILAGSYGKSAFTITRVQVEGYDPGAQAPIVIDSFAWSQINKLDDRLSHVLDGNLDTISRAEERGEAILRQTEMASVKGGIRIPVNCGQQLYDVIDITDSRAGLSAAKKRILGIILLYDPSRGKYEQTLKLGAP